VHRPSLARRFDGFIRTHYSLDKAQVDGSYSHYTAFDPHQSNAFDPLAMSIFYAAINSMQETDVSAVFNTEIPSPAEVPSRDRSVPEATSLHDLKDL
jgi:hypothetical protein